MIREDKPGFVNLVGIESPGLTASLPIARRVAALVGGSLDLSPRADFQARRRGIRRFRDQGPAAQAGSGLQTMEGRVGSLGGRRRTGYRKGCRVFATGPKEPSKEKS